MTSLRPYQQRAVDAVHDAWRNGAERALLVMPTGAGKTLTAAAITEGMRATWLVHRRELAAQAPGPAETVQGLLASGARPDCDVLVADEAHRYGSEAAPQWHAVAKHYRRVLGLTATPARHDGTPLGDLFQALVVGANYGELLQGGWLLPARVVRPPEELEGLAVEPDEAWRRYAGDKQGFAFFSRVELAGQFQSRVEGCATITGTTPADERDQILARFRAGSVRVLSNVQCLTEGVDVPGASVCLLAGGLSHEGAYLQRVGRVLRPAPGATEALVIDLPGCSHRFGLPDADREYSLTGRPIRARLEPLSVCRQCGLTHPTADGACPRCGWQAPLKPVRVRVWSMPLNEAGSEAELTARERSILRYRRRLADAPIEELRELYRRLLAEAASKRTKDGRPYSPAWAAKQFEIRTGMTVSEAKRRAVSVR